MRTLRESILGDMDSTLDNMESDAKKVVNGVMPTIKDFHYMSKQSPWYGITWECPWLIKKFAKDVEKAMQKNTYNDDYKAENIIGMCCMYRESLRSGHLIFGLFLYDKNERRFSIHGIGNTNEAIGARAAERLILKFIEHVRDDHSILDKLADMHNNTKSNWYEDAPYFKDFVKNL